MRRPAARKFGIGVTVILLATILSLTAIPQVMRVRSRSAGLTAIVFGKRITEPAAQAIPGIEATPRDLQLSRLMGQIRREVIAHWSKKLPELTQEQVDQAAANFAAIMGMTDEMVVSAVRQEKELLAHLVEYYAPRRPGEPPYALPEFSDKHPEIWKAYMGAYPDIHKVRARLRELDTLPGATALCGYAGRINPRMQQIASHLYGQDALHVLDGEIAIQRIVRRKERKLFDVSDEVLRDSLKTGKASALLYRYMLAQVRAGKNIRIPHSDTKDLIMRRLEARAPVQTNWEETKN
ncbi:hypothetical protein LCGC14_1986250 [marine sediment metagenome]|uniref:Uncharacterized protein n=1 Tax=marine sediment metagenome TaxID=412755 RepID=A0A0F9FVJ7_9ZZZZ